MKKPPSYIVVYLLGCDDGFAVTSATGDEIRRKCKSGEWLAEGIVVIDGNVVKGLDNKHIAQL